MAKGVKPSMGCGYVVFLVLLLGGAGLLVLGASQYEKAGGRWRKEAVVPAAFGTALVLGAGAYLRLARRLVREGEAEDARRAQFPDQPWKWKQEWQGQPLEADGKAMAAGLWIFAILWNAVSAPGVWFFFKETDREPGMFLVFLFPLVGLGLLWGAVYQTVRWRKYGRTRFVPSSLPGVIGGYLGGVIEVPVRVTPEGDARLTLRCVNRVTRGSGKNRSTSEHVRWEREELIARDQWVSGAGGTRIPVLFYIPPGQPDTDDRDPNNEIVWRLAASAATAGVDFATQFKVPVFATGETAAPPAEGAPLLEEYKPLVLDAAALAACGVRREGDTFHFSSRHLPGTKFTTAVLSLGILALLGWYAGHEVHGVVWGITLFIGLIASLFTLDVWCDRHELRIEAADVVVTKPRPWGTKVVRVPRAEVVAVTPGKSMSSGENQYFRLSLVGAAGVDPAAAPREGEPFRTRKLRHQLGRAEKGEAPRPRAEILADLARAPKFDVQFAKHVPGQARAEAIGALVLAAIRGK